MLPHSHQFWTDVEPRARSHFFAWRPAPFCVLYADLHDPASPITMFRVLGRTQRCSTGNIAPSIGAGSPASWRWCPPCRPCCSSRPRHLGSVRDPLTPAPQRQRGREERAHQPVPDAESLAWLVPVAAAERRTSFDGTAWREVERQVDVRHRPFPPTVSAEMTAPLSLGGRQILPPPIRGGQRLSPPSSPLDERREAASAAPMMSHLGLSNCQRNGLILIGARCSTWNAQLLK